MPSQLAQVITFYIPTVVWRHTKTIICFAYVVNNILASLRTVIIFKIQAIAPPFCFFLGYLFSLALVIGRGKLEYCCHLTLQKEKGGSTK